MGACNSQPEQLHHNPLNQGGDVFGWDGYSEICNPYEGTHPPTAVYQDMTLPLSCYFISSGHNSYLTGNQLNSLSGVSTIRMSLLKGCRVIELDAYNQQAGFDGPVCRHGGTLTPPVSFRDCVVAVREYAFVASPFPVIITIENHTDREGQHDMASILLAVLGEEVLHLPDPDMLGHAWLSPDKLRGKVLIRMNVNAETDDLMRSLVYIPNSKFASLEQANTLGKATSSSFQESNMQELLKKAFTASNILLKPPGPVKVVHGEGEPLRQIHNLPKVALKRISLQRAMSNRYTRPDDGGEGATNQSLSQFMVRSDDSGSPPVLRGMSKPSKSLLRSPGRRLSAQQMASSRAVPQDELEQEVEVDVVKGVHSLGEVYAYNSIALMRTYPNGLRIDSSNYNPVRAWCLGASIVALNWQTWDRPLWINQAMFSQNGGCGYVLKPAWMRRMATLTPGAPVPPLTDIPPDPLPIRTPKRLSVQLLTSYCKQKHHMRLSKREIDVQVSLYGMPMDWQSQRTRTARAWPRACLLIDTTLEFPVFYPEMAILMISLLDIERNDAVLGHWECSLETLSTGSFRIHLTDRHGVQRQDRWIKVALSWAPSATELLLTDSLVEEAAVVAALNGTSRKRMSMISTASSLRA